MPDAATSVCRDSRLANWVARRTARQSRVKDDGGGTGGDVAAVEAWLHALAAKAGIRLDAQVRAHRAEFNHAMYLTLRLCRRSWCCAA